MPTFLPRQLAGGNILALGFALALAFAGAPAHATHDPEISICDRTPQVRDSLVTWAQARANEVTDCSHAGFYIPELRGTQAARVPGGRIWELGARKITSLKPGDFKDLGKVRSIQLQGNLLTALPAGVFEGLSNLEYLDLRNNRLSSLPKGAFDHIPKLTDLFLASNQLSSLPAGIFENLPNLQLLHLGANSFTFPVPPGIFRGVSDPVLAAIGVPSLPQNAAATGGNEELTLYWETPEHTGKFHPIGDLSFDRRALRKDPRDNRLPAGEDALTHYSLRWKLQSAAEFAAKDSATIAAPAARQTISGLVVGATYEVQIAAGNRHAFGNYASATGVVRAANAPSGAPGVPRNLRAIPAEDGGITLEWSAPADNGGGDIAGYRVRWADFADPGVYLNIGGADGLGLPDSPFRYNITGLVNGSTYTAEIAAYHMGPGGPDDIRAGEWAAKSAALRELCRRTPKVRDAVMNGLRAAGALQPDTPCWDVSDEQLAMLTDLNLRKQEIAELQPGDFAGHSGLVSLDLAENELTALPPGLFDGLSSLQSLSVWSNAISEIPAGIFKDLSSLRTLNFGFNRSISELPPGAFAGLSSLTSLLSSNNSIKTLPAGLFDDVPSLVTLRFTNIGLESVEPGLLDGLTALQTVILSHNRIRSVPAGLFTGLSGLRKIELRDTGLAAVPPGLFAGLHNLTDLDLSDNLVASLPENLFRELSPNAANPSSLQTLDLSGNALTTLPAGVFGGLPGLEGLYLSENPLTTLPPRVFAELPALRFLGLRDIRFPAMLPPGVFENLGDDVLTANGLPGRPRHLAATASSDYLQVHWNPPARAGGSGIAAYALRWKPETAGGFAADDRAIVRAPALNYAINGLAAGTYEVQVAAGNAFAFGHYASALGAPHGTGAAQRQALGAPRNLRATPGNASAALIWSPPATDGGSDITGYKVRWANTAQPAVYLNTNRAAGEDAEGGASGFRYRVTGLTNGAAYIAEVAARNSDGAGPYAATTFSPESIPLNVDGDDAVTGTDGILVSRYLLGLRGTLLINGIDGADLNEVAIETNIGALAEGATLDVDGSNAVTAADGIMIARGLLGITGAALTAGQTATAAENVQNAIDALKAPP
ncbi:MAG: leucine-rich repeat domain-containing protein [Gammaproteobacteria bacterium]|nr:leucine-rich repeat domain-containing protein [Gammaproteobacteria bacterium]